MTFVDIVQRVQTRLNLQSADSATRIGIFVNDRHRWVTSSTGLGLTRRTTITGVATSATSLMTFSECEKLFNVIDHTFSPFRVLDEVTIEELRDLQPFVNNQPLQYAISNYGPRSVTIELDCTPTTTSNITLSADALQTIVDLHDTMEPNLPESFHDVLMWGALEDELRKMMKKNDADDARDKFETRLGELRYFLAKSGYLNYVQGRNRREFPFRSRFEVLVQSTNP